MVGMNQKVASRLNLRLAKTMGEDHQRIYYWKANGVPPGRVVDVCAALNWEVTPHEVRPDIYQCPWDSLPADMAAKAIESHTGKTVAAA